MNFFYNFTLKVNLVEEIINRGNSNLKLAPQSQYLYLSNYCRNDKIKKCFRQNFYDFLCTLFSFLDFPICKNLLYFFLLQYLKNIMHFLSINNIQNYISKSRMLFMIFEELEMFESDCIFHNTLHTHIIFLNKASMDLYLYNIFCYF